MSKSNIDPAEKLRTVHQILDGKETQHHAASRLEISWTSIQQWISIYNSEGEEAFIAAGFKRYSKELKEQAVLDYLSGQGSQMEICQRYGIRAKSKLQKWIKQYNNHEELTDSRPEGGRYLMAKDIKPRKTTQKERFEIVEYCISNSNNYALAAKEFDCSYSQVYTWVKKYKEKGIDGLADRRGRGKPKDELSDIEKLKAENRILKAEKKRQQMEIDLLKKLENIERR